MDMYGALFAKATSGGGGGGGNEKIVIVNVNASSGIYETGYDFNTIKSLLNAGVYVVLYATNENCIYIPCELLDNVLIYSNT